MSVRTDLRNTVVTNLLGIAAFADNVYPGRRRSIPRADLPAACVYVESESKDLSNTNQPRTFLRELVVNIEIFSSDTAGDYAELDTLCKSVETALLADEDLGGAALEIMPLSDEYEISEEGDHSGVFALSKYVIRYVD